MEEERGGEWGAGGGWEWGHSTSLSLLQVYGDKDADGFYRGETCARLGLIPCNMVSEIQADDEEVREQLLRQGFLPLHTPVEKTGAGAGRAPVHSGREVLVEEARLEHEAAAAFLHMP